MMISFDYVFFIIAGDLKANDKGNDVIMSSHKKENISNMMMTLDCNDVMVGFNMMISYSKKIMKWMMMTMMMMLDLADDVMVGK